MGTPTTAPNRFEMARTAMRAGWTAHRQQAGPVQPIPQAETATASTDNRGHSVTEHQRSLRQLPGTVVGLGVRTQKKNAIKPMSLSVGTT